MLVNAVPLLGNAWVHAQGSQCSSSSKIGRRSESVEVGRKSEKCVKSLQRTIGARGSKSEPSSIGRRGAAAPPPPPSSNPSSISRCFAAVSAARAARRRARGAGAAASALEFKEVFCNLPTLVFFSHDI